MRPVFGIDLLTSEHYSARRRLIALNNDPLVARQILRDLDLPGEAHLLAAARPPPQRAFGFWKAR
jgi:hypothetical protein